MVIDIYCYIMCNICIDIYIYNYIYIYIFIYILYHQYSSMCVSVLNVVLFRYLFVILGYYLLICIWNIIVFMCLWDRFWLFLWFSIYLPWYCWFDYGSAMFCSFYSFRQRFSSTTLHWSLSMQHWKLAQSLRLPRRVLRKDLFQCILQPRTLSLKLHLGRRTFANMWKLCALTSMQFTFLLWTRMQRLQLLHLCSLWMIHDD